MGNGVMNALNGLEEKLNKIIKENEQKRKNFEKKTKKRETTQK